MEENSFDIEEACDDIFLSRPIVEKKKFEKIDELLFYFEDQMSDNATRVPVETKTVYNDLLGFYKSSKFHPDRPLKIILNWSKELMLKTSKFCEFCKVQPSFCLFRRRTCRG